MEHNHNVLNSIFSNFKFYFKIFTIKLIYGMIKYNNNLLFIFIIYLLYQFVFNCFIFQH